MIDFRQYEEGDRDICGRKCPKCGRVYYPEPMVCTQCGTRRDPSGMRFPEWERVPIAGRCRLLSWTKLFNLPSDFTDRYLLFGIVEFENGIRASGRLKVERPVTGMALTARTGVVRGAGDDAERGLVFEEAETPRRRRGAPQAATRNAAN